MRFQNPSAEGPTVNILGLHVTIVPLGIIVWLLLVAASVANTYRKSKGDHDWSRERMKSAIALSATMIGSLVFLLGLLGGIAAVITVQTSKTAIELKPILGKPYYVVSQKVEKSYPTVTIQPVKGSMIVTASPYVYYSQNEDSPRFETFTYRYGFLQRLYGLDRVDIDPEPARIYVPALEKSATWFNGQHRKVRDLDSQISDLDQASSYDGSLPSELVAEQRRLTWDKIHALAIDRDLTAEIYNREAGTASETDFYLQVEGSGVDLPYQIPAKYRSHWSVVTTATP